MEELEAFGSKLGRSNKAADKHVADQVRHLRMGGGCAWVAVVHGRFCHHLSFSLNSDGLNALDWLLRHARPILYIMQC